MVAADFLRDQRVQGWLHGVEPAWTLLTFESLLALRQEPSAVQSAIQIANDLSVDEIASSAVARPQPLHNLSVRVATGWDSLHRLLSEELGLLFRLSFIFRKRHPLADNFSPRLVFRLHVQNPVVSSVVKHI